MSLDEVTGNGNECKNGGEIFFIDFVHGKFLLSIDDNFTENHPDYVLKFQAAQPRLLKAILRQAICNSIVFIRALLSA